MEQARKPYATARSATGLTVLSTLSPLAGLAAEMALAWRFGASATVDAFRIGALLLLFGQQLFSIHVVPNIIVPVFTEYRAQGKEREAWQMSLSMANALLIPTFLISLLFFIWPDPVIHLLAPGLMGEARGTTLFFVRWFFLTLIPLVWTGVAVGIFYTQGVFWLPAASQLLSNIVLTTAILVFGSKLGPTSVVIGILVSSLASWILFASRLLPLMRRVGVQVSFRINANHPGVRKAFRLALPLVGMLTLTQWSAIIINRVLSELPVGTLATFGYAWKMGQIVLLLPASLVTVLFARFAESWHSSSEREFREVCTRALRTALFIALPLTCVSFVLRVPLVALLFQRGEFSPDVARTAARLFGLLILGTSASVVYMYLVKMLYAAEEMWVPAYTQLAGALFLTVVAPFMAARFGADGVALVSAVLPWLTALALLWILDRKYKAIRIKELGMLTMEIVPLAMVSAWLGGQGAKAIGQFTGSGELGRGLTIVGGMSLGVIAFYGASLLLHLPEALQGQRYLQWQKGVMVSRLQNVLRG